MPTDRIREIEARIVDRRPQIDAWMLAQASGLKLPFYTSADLRNAGYKIAAIDTNLFPAGFNNLCGKFFDHSADSARRFIQGRFGAVKRVLLLPETHTRNAFYVDNVAALERILLGAGYEVRLGFLGEARDEVVEVRGTKGDVHSLYKLRREGDTIAADGFTPDLVILNNDLAGGRPAILDGIRQPITPPLEVGWYARRKNVHFDLLHGLVGEFAAILDVDPWLLSAITDYERDVDFQSSKGLDRLAAKVDGLLARVQSKYKEHGIPDKPYAFIKHNAGTYGMAIITVESGDDIRNPNRKMRQRMSAGKGNVQVNEVLIQEGVPSTDVINDCTGEPVMYLIGIDLIGGFFRQHCGKSERENLNQSGSTFARLCFRAPNEAAPSSECYYDTCLRTVYGVMAQVAALAAGHEIKRMAPSSP
jgi:glutamate--cysteine ligase